MNKDDAIRQLFNTMPFSMLINQGLEGIHGNQDGKIFGSWSSGDNFEIKDYTLSQCLVLIQAVFDHDSRSNPLEMDVSVSGRNFCITSISHPIIIGNSWSVVLRDVVSPKVHKEISTTVELKSLKSLIDPKSPYPIDLGRSLSADCEGSYRRGYLHAISELALMMKEYNCCVTANDLNYWIEGPGNRWRSNVPLSRKILASKLFCTEVVTK